MKTKNLSNKQVILILLSLMASLLLAALDSTVVSTAMKMIVNDLQGMKYYAWPFTIYMLSSTVIIPISGGFADSFGRKPIFIIGIISFLAGSALCGISHSMLQLISFRAIQGLGGGIIISGVFTLIADIFPPQKRGKYMGIVSSMFGLASIIGPLIGGFITDQFNWRWIFLSNIPVGIIAMILILFNMPNYRSASPGKRIDYLGAAFLLLFMIPMLLAFRFAGTDYTWNSPQIISLFAFSGIMLILFIYFEAKAGNPILPLYFFKQRSISVTLVIAFLTNLIMFAAIMYIPYFVQGIIGTNATTSGAITTPMMLGLMLSSNVTGFAMSRRLYKKISVILAFILMVIGTGLLSTIGPTTTYPSIILFMILLGLGIGINMPVTSINVQNSVTRDQISTATATVQFFRNIGSTIGSAIFGTVMMNSMNSGFAKLDVSYIPDNVKSLLKNPQILTSPDAIKELLSKVPTEYLGYFKQVIQAAKLVLSDAIGRVFLFCLTIAVAGLILSLFFKDASQESIISQESLANNDIE